MSRNFRLVNAELTVITHATEDAARVCSAVKNLLPSDLRGSVDFKEESTTGHHGNPITTLKATITDKGDIEQLVAGLAPKLSTLDRTTLSNELERCIDEDGNLYLRFDKQAAFLGEVRFKQEDAIRVRIRLQGWGHKLEAMRRICQEMGLID
jgi:hypothetical protein